MSIIGCRYVNSDLLYAMFNIKENFEPFDSIGDIHSNHGERILTYIKDEVYLPIILENNRIAGVICTPAIAKRIDENLIKIIHEDPVLVFFSIVDYFGKNIGSINKSVLRTEVQVAVPEYDVYIGSNVKIEPNVVILPGVIIEDNVFIRAGAILGLDSFQHQRTAKGIFSPCHDGYLHIKSYTEIGANSTISRGFSYRNTIIGEHNKIDAQSYIAHGSQIGRSNIICAGTRIMGHSVIGNDNFIGPGAIISSRISIGNNTKISLGSVVTKNVKDSEKVSGNFAIPHDKFIAKLKS
uniref:UDP-3-O-(R-3-hydroxymyristoyl)-glucosamine-N-acyltransferase n=1 Tax=Yersinia similis TaxID=367190 RepID=S0F2L5_9GAMM|nr:UDP-3-O-(R-3-hydroxymyristoyl)-glucosamine-N-acyltransferase [Yersinia similis]